MDRSSVPPSDSMFMVERPQPNDGPSGGVAGGNRWASHMGIYSPIASVGFLDGQWCDAWGYALKPVSLASSRLSDAYTARSDRMGDDLVVDPTQPICGMD